MKNVLNGNDNRIKRRVSAVMAGVIAITSIGTITYFKQKTVQARETLYSIEKVIDDLRVNKSSYKILEIVPDKASVNVTFEYVSGNQTGKTGGVSIDITQYPGFLGYYVGGSEPVRDDVDDIVNGSHMVSFTDTNAYSTTLDESTLRYNTVQIVYNAIKDSDVYDVKKGPFSLEEGYSEIRQGEYISSSSNDNDGTVDYGIVKDDELENGLNNGYYGLIKRDDGYVDLARGIMKSVPAGKDEAHYVLKYDPDIKDGEVDDDDPANMLLSEFLDYCVREEISDNRIYFDSNNDFIISCAISENSISEDSIDVNSTDEERLWEFDPYLVNDNTESANIYAVFEALSLGDDVINEFSSGYRVINAEAVDKDALPGFGTPIYTFNNETGRYEYYRNCDEEFVRELTISEEENEETPNSNESTSANDIRIISKDVVRDPAHTDNRNKAVLKELADDKIKDESNEHIDSLINDEEIETDSINAPDEMHLVDDTLDQNTGEENSDTSDEEGLEYDVETILNTDVRSESEETGSEYYILTFAYFDDYQSSDLLDIDSGFYGVKYFRYADNKQGAQYSINKDDGLIVPNLMNRGVISVRDDHLSNNLLYEYNKDTSKCNLRWSGDENSEKAYRIVGAKIYYKYGIENKEWFKRYVFDRDCYPYDTDNVSKDTAASLKVKVVRKTASEVILEDIMGTTTDSSYACKMIVLMAGNGEYCVPNSNYKQYAAGIRDITSDVYTRILYRVFNTKDNIPIIVDHAILDNEPTAEFKDSLMYNLAYALSYKNASDYSKYVYSKSSSIVSGGLANTELSPVKYASIHNCELLNYNNGDYVNGNIYMYNRKSGTKVINILNRTFDEEEFSNSTIDEGFSEVREDIEREKKYREADYSLKDKPLTNARVTEATVIRYIIGNGKARSTSGKGEITVLELEPTNCFDLEVENKDITDDYTVGSEDYENLAIEETVGNDIVKKIYEGDLRYKNQNKGSIITQKGLKINLKQMTTAEFVGHVEDLNATYDLIYIGMNTGYTDGNGEYRLVDTWEKWVQNPTQWNDPGLNDGYQWNWLEHAADSEGYSLDECDHTDGCHYLRKRYWGDSHRVVYEKYSLMGEDLYGGFHHRMSTQEDVSAGRSLSANQPITDYNDDNMDGLVYCNVGDMTYISETVGGSLKVWTGDTDSDGNKVYKWPEYVGEERYLNKEDEKNHNETDQTKLKTNEQITVDNSSELGYDGRFSLYRTRYSGNDITKDNMQALIDFSLAGYPIILADEFYSDYDISNRTGTINECTVDNSSYMYKAITSINNTSSDKNVFIQSYVPTDLFNWYVLNLGKPTIRMTDETCKAAQKSTVYLSEDQKSGDGHYNAYYRFKIDSMGTASAGTRYNIGLFIDINADGKYSRKSEGIAFSSIKDYNTSATISPTGTDSETKMPIYSLEPGHEYEARCKLSGSFVGCLPWRLCVSQIGNPYRRNNADGYYAVRNNERRVKILQIRQNDGYYWGTTWNMKEDYNSKGTFYNLITDTAYMPFRITGRDKKIEGSDEVTYEEGPDSITVSEFENIIEDEEKTSDAYYNFLARNYDMVILGFADIYHGPNMTAAKGIKKYIENGYSVLFTHDCTSFVNSYNRDGLLGDNWGYEFNSLIRNIVGMDRYDVLAESTHENEKPYKPRSNCSVDKVLDYEKHGFTYHILNHWGYQNENNIAEDGRQSRHMYENKNPNKTFLKYTNFVGVSIGNGQYDETNYVTQVNKGQITQYPYVLKEEFSVAKTHSQYYQLDLTADDDNDEESDIVVWYCISRIGEPGNTAYQKNMYNISPNDVRNNYYIYNKGNVTYSGVGHSPPTGEDELKLFINTMIASFRTGLHEPDLAVVDGYKDNPSKVRNLYVSYDDEIRKAVVSGNTLPISGNANKVNIGSESDKTEVNKNSDIDNTVDMYFNAEQVSLVQNASSIDHGLFARVFFKDDLAEHTLGYYCGEEYIDETYKNIKVSPLDLTDRVFAKDSDTALSVESGHTNSTVGGVEINEAFMNGCVKVGNGITYKVKVPVTDNMLWGGSNKASLGEVGKSREILVVTRDYASYKNSGGDVYKVSLTNWAVDKVGLARVEVFDLD